MNRGGLYAVYLVLRWCAWATLGAGAIAICGISAMHLRQLRAVHVVTSARSSPNRITQADASTRTQNSGAPEARHRVAIRPEPPYPWGTDVVVAAVAAVIAAAFYLSARVVHALEEFGARPDSTLHPM